MPAFRACSQLTLVCLLLQGCVSYQRSYHTVVQHAGFPDADSADVGRIFAQLQYEYLPNKEQRAPQARALLDTVACPVPARGRLRFADFLVLDGARDDETWLVLEPNAKLYPRSEESWPAGTEWQWSLYVQLIFVRGADQLRLASRAAIDFKQGAADDFPWLARELSHVSATWLAEQVQAAAAQLQVAVELRTEPTLED